MSEPGAEPGFGVSEADWLEQQTDETVVGTDSPVLPAEADDADVAEQHQELPPGDEDELVILDDEQAEE